MEKVVSVAGGIRLAYAEQGSPEGIPLVFLHGVTDSWRSFESVLNHLPHTIHAFAISQRGHGDSSRPVDRYGLRDFSEDVRAFMDAVALPEAVIVGHSMGASVAQRFVLDHGHRVAGLVLLGAFASFDGRPDLTEFVTNTIIPLRDPIAPDFVRQWQRSTLARPVPREFFDTIVQETLKVPARVWHAAFTELLAGPTFVQDLADIDVPTLIVWGDRDTYATREDQETLRTVIPRARFLSIAGAGHACHWEDPAQFASELMSFVFEPRATPSR